jgi:hypothetical protein
MPHYKNGVKAEVGDWVQGKTYNTQFPVAGQIISLTPNASTCNCVVAYLEAVPNLEGAGRVEVTKVRGHQPGDAVFFYRVNTDYTETGYLEPLWPSKSSGTLAEVAPRTLPVGWRDDPVAQKILHGEE